MNCLLEALAMSLGLMCVLSLKVIELLSCCGGRLCASPCSVPVGAWFFLWSHGFSCGPMVFPVVPWFFYVFPPDFGLVCAYEGGDFFV